MSANAPSATSAVQPAEPARGRRLPPGSVIVLAFVALLIGSRLAYPGFFDGQNLENLVRQNDGLGLTSIGVGFVIIAGGWDLSVGSTASLAGVIFAKVSLHHPTGLGIVVALAVVTAAGYVNGLLVTRLRIDSFMATLGTGVIFEGLALDLSLSGGVTVNKSSFAYLGLAHWAGIPLDIIILVVALVVGAILLARMKFGQQVRAVGGDLEAARLAGIPTRRVKELTYMMSAFLAGLGGLIATSKVGLAQADANSSLTLEAIAVVVVGGISVRGGEGAIWRVALGLLILATLNNLYAALQWSQQIQEVTQGAVVLLALGAEQFSRDPLVWRRWLRVVRRPPHSAPDE